MSQENDTQGWSTHAHICTCTYQHVLLIYQRFGPLAKFKLTSIAFSVPLCAIYVIRLRTCLSVNATVDYPLLVYLTVQIKMIILKIWAMPDTVNVHRWIIRIGIHDKRINKHKHYIQLYNVHMYTCFCLHTQVNFTLKCIRTVSVITNSRQIRRN